MTKAKRNNNNGPGHSNFKRLPYDFVPFDKDQYRFPYTSEASPNENKMLLPRHDRVEEERLSGVLRYEMIPHSDLVVEIRKKLDGGSFISGSVVRGKIRSNVEMLSRSFPEFVNREPLLHREIQSSKYKSRLFGIDESEMDLKVKGIEHYIQAGYLHKSKEKFFIIPAQKIGDKHFLSIHEHRLKKMDVGKTKNRSVWLYYWNKGAIDKLTHLQNQIDRLTNEIKQLREPYRDMLKDSPISEWFSNCMAFSKIRSDTKNKIEAMKKEKREEITKSEIEKQLLDCRREHLDDLVEGFIHEKGLTEPQASDIKRIYDKTFERWKLKWEIEGIYQSNAKNNWNFAPYQKCISFELDENDGVRNISFNDKKYKLQGILFNSTNASSKRSHYLIGPQDMSASVIAVKDEVINAYNRNFKRMRFPQLQDKPEQRRREMEQKLKDFYNLFEYYDELSREHEPIVFFRLDSSGDVSLGRTPHMKIFFNLDHLLGTKPSNAVDYASALFGYVDESKSDSMSSAYKSRVVFRPVDIAGDPDSNKHLKHFILMTPQPTASGMYLEQVGKTKKTYADPAETLKLNGLKYYHVRTGQQEPSKGNEDKAFSSARFVYDKDTIGILTGTIVFQNLTREELGLLLLAADIRLIRGSKYWDNITKSHPSLRINEEFLSNCFELIGGAKPYGYGKVRVIVQELQLKGNSYDFESLMTDNMTNKPQENWGEYIDAFLEEMGGERFVQSELFGAYMASKTVLQDNEFSRSDIKSWECFFKNDIQGYGRNWRLKRRYRRH